MTDHPAPPQTLAGRVALVTGASGGIGSALTRRLLGAGAHVVASSRHSEDVLPDVDHPRLDRLDGDMSRLSEVPGVVRRIERDHGRLDALVPNAGVGEVRTLDQTTLADWQTALDVNLTAPFLLAQAAAEGMRQRGWGRILFTSSAAAYVGGFVGPHYAASKAALHGLVHFLSARLAGDGVTTNAIAPALIDGTDMITGLRGTPPPVPVGRLGQPDEVADLALAMLTNGYLTGQVVLLDGGLHPT